MTASRGTPDDCPGMPGVGMVGREAACVRGSIGDDRRPENHGRDAATISRIANLTGSSLGSRVFRSREAKQADAAPKTTPNRYQEAMSRGAGFSEKTCACNTTA